MAAPFREEDAIKVAEALHDSLIIESDEEAADNGVSSMVEEDKDDDDDFNLPRPMEKAFQNPTR